MNNDGTFGLLFILGFLWIYLLPSFIAFSHHRRNKAAITVLDILLGWTFVGWVIALVWATIEDDGAGEIRIERR